MSGYIRTVLYVLLPLLTGAFLKRMKRLRPFTIPLFNQLENMIMSVILPLTVLVSVARYSLSELVGGLAAMAMALLAVGGCFLFSTGVSFLA
ncbi:MAG: hypothetical protein QXF66_05010, partial [Candidatus Hadarchaeales archaeon]